jgi:hypothetical protein
MAKREKFISRRIYFYRVEDPQSILTALPDDLARLANLPFNESGRYAKEGEGERLCVWPDSFEFPLKLRFGRTRLQNLPTKKHGGKLEALNLEAEAGLAELVHVIIFADGYVAAEFNFEAPRMKRLGAYLYEKKYKLPTKPTFLPLFQKDILQLVQAMPAINFLELKGSPDAQYLLSEADKNLGNAYGTIGSLGADRSIELSLRAQKQPDSKLKKLCVRLAHVAQSQPWEVRTSVTKLKVKGITAEGKFDEVDLLEDHLIAVRQFEKISNKDKAISSESAYREMMDAYDERRSDFASATAGRMLV